MNVAPPRRIETPDFVLRCWSAGDAPLLRAALDVSETHLRAWTPWVVDGRVPGLTLEQRLAGHEAAFVAGTEWVYGMLNPDGTEVLGAASLHPRVGPNAIEVGYWINVNHTGRGLATRAAAELTRVAFASPEMERVEMRITPGNTRSMLVPKRLGYRVIKDGTTADRAEPNPLTIWEITRAEFAGH